MVMNIKVSSRCKKMLKLREELIAAEKERFKGKKGYSIDELDKMLGDVVSDVLEVSYAK